MSGVTHTGLPGPRLPAPSSGQGWLPAAGWALPGAGEGRRGQILPEQEQGLATILPTLMHPWMLSSAASRHTTLEAAALLLHPGEVEEHQGVGQEPPLKLGLKNWNGKTFPGKKSFHSKFHTYVVSVRFFFSFSCFFYFILEGEHVSPQQKSLLTRH